MNSSTDAAYAIHKLQHHLLHGPAQLRSGPQAGGVAGGLSPDGGPLYVYGEITGYYLHWLASLTTETAACVANAVAAQQWLGTFLALDPWPPTRLYLSAGHDDWRNSALFAFDLAMIAGGLARAAAHGLIELDALTVRRLETQLCRMIDDGKLKTLHTLADPHTLPQRWSTVGGPFTAKTASRILLLDEQFPLDSALTDCCRRQLAHYAALVPQFPEEMLHPSLYALEGLLLAPSADPRKIALSLDRLLALQTANGHLPETPGSTLYRNDIVAQALRLAVLLEYRLGEHGRYEDSIQKMAAVLIRQIADDGTLAFAEGHSSGGNTWCAMFAEQALRLYYSRESAQRPALAETDLA